MNKKEKAHKIQQILNALYPTPAIPLKHSDPFTLLIAVLLSAQCTDARVNTITPNLFQKASTPKAMSLLSIEEIEEVIHSCGFSWTKAKAIQKTSQILCEKYAGQVPASFSKLEELPGVGHKTASVVMAQAFGKAAFPVDTHIHRCAKRWGLSQAKNVEQTEHDLKRLFYKKDWTRLHLQIIYFARQYCTARTHDPKLCPICSWI
jgi:endonuclease III